MKLSSKKVSTINLSKRPLKGIRRKIYIIIFEAETFYGKIFDMILLGTILVSIVAVMIESDKNTLSSQYQHELLIVEWVVTGIFTIEYILRLIVSKYPWQYAKSFFGVIDLLTVLPSYLSIFIPGTQSLMVLRVLRLLRIFRIFKLIRFIKAGEFLAQSLYANRYKIAIFLGVIASLVLIMGTFMYMVEGDQYGFSSIPKSMYWAIVTITTVGYGDVVPQTSLGRFTASIMMLIGYAIIAIPTGIMSSQMLFSHRKVSKDFFTAQCPRCLSPTFEDANYCHVCAEKLKNNE